MPESAPSTNAVRARHGRTVFLVLAAVTMGAQVAGLVWVAQGQVERGRALQGGGAVTRLISSDPCLDYRIAAAPPAGDRCGPKANRPMADAR